MVSVYRCEAATCKWNENKRCCHSADEITLGSGGNCKEYEMNSEEE